MIKKLFVFQLFLGLSICSIWGQAGVKAKKPTLMVVPSDVWCFKNGYFSKEVILGDTIETPNYKAAFQKNSDLIQVISQINGKMADEGFPLKNMETVIKGIEQDAVERTLLLSKLGAGIAESPIDQIKRVAKADIILQLTWTVDSLGPKKTVNYSLQGLDAYTDKEIATAVGDSGMSFSSSTATLIATAVEDNMEMFKNRLLRHFTDMFANGREIIVRVLKWNDWNDDLETEYEGEELGFILEDWLAENTLEGRFNTTDLTESMALFEQVRIPVANEKGRAIDARRYARDLVHFLKNPPYEIPAKLYMRGLGEVVLILGGK